MTTNYSSANTTPCRQQSCIRTVRLAHDLGFLVSIIDSGSHKAFLQFCEGYGARVVPQSGVSHASARLEAIRLAMSAGTDYVYWTEDDKPAIIKYLPSLVRAADCSNAMLTIPFRASLRHYVPTEAAMYRFGRSIAIEMLNAKLDLFLGASLIASQFVIRWLSQTSPTCPWSAIHAPRIEAIRDHVPILSAMVPFVRSRQLHLEEKGVLSIAQKRASQIQTLTALFFSTLQSHFESAQSTRNIRYADLTLPR